MVGGRIVGYLEQIIWLIFGLIFWFIWARFAHMSGSPHHPFWDRLGSNWAHFGAYVGSSFGRTLQCIKPVRGRGCVWLNAIFSYPHAKTFY